MLNKSCPRRKINKLPISLERSPPEHRMALEGTRLNTIQGNVCVSGAGNSARRCNGSHSSTDRPDKRLLAGDSHLPGAPDP